MNGSLLPAVLARYSHLMLNVNKAPDSDKAEVSYRTLLSRKPTAQARGLSTTEDLIYALLNTQCVRLHPITASAHAPQTSPRDELTRRDFAATTARALLGVGLLPGLFAMPARAVERSRLESRLEPRPVKRAVQPERACTRAVVATLKQGAGWQRATLGE